MDNETTQSIIIWFDDVTSLNGGLGLRFDVCASEDTFKYYNYLLLL